MGACEDMRVDAPDGGDFFVRRIDATEDYGIAAVDNAAAFGGAGSGADDLRTGADFVGNFSAALRTAGEGVAAAKGAARALGAVDERGKRAPAVASSAAQSAKEGFERWAKTRPEAAFRFLKEQTRAAWEPQGEDASAATEGMDELASAASAAVGAPRAADHARGAVLEGAERRLAGWDNLAARHQAKAAKAGAALGGPSRDADGSGHAFAKFRKRYHQSKAELLRGEGEGVLGRIMKLRRGKNEKAARLARRPAFFLALPAALLAFALFGMVGCSVVSAAATGIASALGSQPGGQNPSLNAVENVVASFFTQKGLTPLQTAAIMGNMYGESGMQPGILQGFGVVGDSFSNETILSFGNEAGIGAGLCQWDLGRRAGLARYAESVDKSWSDPSVQLEFFWDHDEWSDWGGNSARRETFLTTDDLGEAVEAFAFGWERCDPAYAHLNTRKTAAQRYYLALTVAGTGTGQDYAAAGDAQKAVADAALTMRPYGASQGWCQMWVKNVYASCGRSGASACCAHAAGDNWIVSPSSAGIPVGATVYGSRSWGGVMCGACGRDACHVGIYVGDGTVVSMEAGVQARTLDDWVSVYGWRGWGWNGGDDLTR